MLAITGTADEKAQSVITKQLVLKGLRNFQSKPGKLRISVIKCHRENMHAFGLAC